MKNTSLRVALAAAAVTVAFGVGHLTAQPARVAPQPAPKPVDPVKEAFLGDLNASIRENHFSKTTKLLSDAAGEPGLTDVVIQKAWVHHWNAVNKDDLREAERAQMLQSTFAIQQRQRQIALLEAVLAELKKDQRKN